jgi:hypothetical protein
MLDIELMEPFAAKGALYRVLIDRDDLSQATTGRQKSPKKLLFRASKRLGERQ